MKKIAAIFAMLALAACTNEEEVFSGPAGQKVHSTKCNFSSTKCLKKASQVCRGKYAAISSSSNSGGIAADLFPGPVMWYRMQYVCGRTGPHPQFPLKGAAPRSVPIYVPPAQPAPQPNRPINCTTRRNGAHIQTSCF